MNASLLRFVSRFSFIRNSDLPVLVSGGARSCLLLSCSAFGLHSFVMIFAFRLCVGAFFSPSLCENAPQWARLVFESTTTHVRETFFEKGIRQTQHERTWPAAPGHAKFGHHTTREAETRIGSVLRLLLSLELSRALGSTKRAPTTTLPCTRDKPTQKDSDMVGLVVTCKTFPLSKRCFWVPGDFCHPQCFVRSSKGPPPFYRTLNTLEWNSGLKHFGKEILLNERVPFNYQKIGCSNFENQRANNILNFTGMNVIPKKNRVRAWGTTHIVSRGTNACSVEIKSSSSQAKSSSTTRNRRFSSLSEPFTWAFTG